MLLIFMTILFFSSCIILMILVSFITKKNLEGSCSSNEKTLKKIPACEVCPNSEDANNFVKLSTLGYSIKNKQQIDKKST